MRLFAWCLGLGSVVLMWRLPAGEWAMIPALLVIPWMVERRAVRRQMDRELADLIAPPAP